MATSPRRFDGPPPDSDAEKPAEGGEGAPRRTHTQPMMPAVTPPPPPPPAVVISRVLEVGPPLVPRRPVAPAFEAAPPPVATTPSAPPVPPPPPSSRSAMATSAFDDSFFETAPAPLPRSEPPAPAPPPRQRPALPTAKTGGNTESLWDSVEALLDDVDAGFGAIMGDSPSPLTTRDGGPPPPERVPSSGGLSDARALFASLAASHVRNVRDFMIDLESGQATSEWIPVCEPAVRGVRQMAEQLELGPLCQALDAYAAALKAASEKAAFTIDGPVRDELTQTYAPLVQLMPQAFALGEAKSKREGIIVQSLLLQIPEVRKVSIDKLYSAGLTSLEALFIAKADEVSLTTGISMPIAEKIVERFRRYRREMQGASKDEARSFEKDQLHKLTGELRKAQAAFEQAERDDNSSKKRDARKARESAVLEIKVLLARLGEVERLQKIEKLPFAQKVTELEATLEALDKPSP